MFSTGKNIRLSAPLFSLLFFLSSFAFCGDADKLNLRFDREILAGAAGDGNTAEIHIYWKPQKISSGHRPWIWNHGFQIYEPGKETEDTLTVILQNPEKPDFFDIWIWRAWRSSGMKTADDLYAEYDGENLKISFDNGVLPWRVYWPSSYEGDTLPRYSFVRPSGSAADVSAEASQDGEGWSLTLSRACDTGNGDDLKLTGKINLFITSLPVSELDFTKLKFREVDFDSLQRKDAEK